MLEAARMTITPYLIILERIWKWRFGCSGGIRLRSRRVTWYVSGEERLTAVKAHTSLHFPKSKFVRHSRKEDLCGGAGLVATPFPRVMSIQRRSLPIQLLPRSPTRPVFTSWSGKAIVSNCNPDRYHPTSNQDLVCLVT